MTGLRRYRTKNEHVDGQKSGAVPVSFDLNAFFASCEQQENPALRGHPIIVVQAMTDSAVAIAASYAAKAFGIKTGIVVRDARQLCPGVVPVAG
jgi:DNA polymerase-4